MGQKYWLSRERAAIRMAYMASTSAVRRIHLELADQFGLKAESLNPLRKLPVACKRVLQPVAKIVPIFLRRPRKVRPLILICDDEQLTVDLLQHHLRKSGFDVVSAADGAAALERMHGRLPAAVILEIMIPVINGTEVLKQIRETPIWHKVPVMILSHRNSENDVVAALQDGASDYLTKPFMIGEVIERVRRLITPYEHPLESLLEELAA